MKSIIKVLMGLLLASNSYSQKIVLNSSGDTTICFTISQAKFILKLPLQIKEQKELLQACQMECLYYDSLSINDSLIIVSQSKIIKNNESAAVLNKSICESEKNTIKSEVLRQRRHKRIAIVVAVFFAAVVIWQNKK